MTGGRGTTVPLGELPRPVVTRLEELGAAPEATKVGFLRALANNEAVALGWIELSSRLRSDAVTRQRLRELMICRLAVVSGCEYQLTTHRAVAREARVVDDELDQLSDWRSIRSLSDAERTALALCDAMDQGELPDELFGELERHFDAAERVGLIVTIALYGAVPRIVAALGLPVDEVFDRRTNT